MEWMIVLVACGLLLVVAEIFLPGAVLGLAGAGCLIAAAFLAFERFGAGGGLLFTLAEIVLGAVVVLQAVRWIPRTPLGRGLVLESAVEGAAPAAENQALLGAEGVALTPLRPAGSARIRGRRVDVVTEGGLIEPDTAVKVIAVEGMRIVVRRIEK